MNVHTRSSEAKYLSTKVLLGPVAPSWFSTELDQVGRRELVYGDCALHHF